MIDTEIDRHVHRYGKYDKVESYQDKDMLTGDITELDEEGNSKKDGIHQKGVMLMPAHLKDEEQKALFAGIKVGDKVVFNPYAAYKGSESEIAYLLSIEAKAASTVKSDFSFQSTEITRYAPAALNQELFDQIYEAGVVKTEEDFRARIKADLTDQYAFGSRYKFISDIRKLLSEKANDLEFSETLLKRLIRLKAKNPMEEDITENYEKAIQTIKWGVIKEHLAKKNNIEIESENLLEAAKDYTRVQFAQYGMANIPDDIIESHVNDMLKKEETRNQLIDRAIEDKLITVVKEQVKVNYKTVSLEEFNQMLA
jgi:trigger factor